MYSPYQCITMDNRLNITLFVGAREYKYPIPREHEEAYRRAAELINEKLARYTERFPGKSDQEYIMATMFDVAVRLTRNQIGQDATEVLKSVRLLSEEIDEVL